jgi:peptidyl-prolyl cis-trans isomerase B (cyclophilin B)
VGTEKRERQKSNRALKLEQEQHEARARAVRKKIVRIALIVLLALAGVVFIAWMGGAFDDDTALAPAPPDTDQTDTDQTDTTPDQTDTDETDTAPVDDADAVPAGCPATDGSESQQRSFDEPPPMCLVEGTQYSAVVITNFGEYTIELDAEQAPLTVNNFVTLARYKYFDDTECHRIIPDFVVQCGDPTATGTGGPGYRIDDELPEAGEYQIGSVAMANSGPDTNGSQFFVITGPQGEALSPNFSLFGQVTDGLDTVAALDAVGTPGGSPSETVRIESVEILTS